MKKLIFGCCLAIATTSLSQGALGEVNGKVVEKKTGEPIYGAQVYIEDNGTKYQALTDFDGNFRISAIPAGDYIVNIKSGIDTMKTTQAKIPMDDICRLGVIKFDNHIQIIGTITVGPPPVRLINGSLPVTQIGQGEIKSSPAKFNPKQLIAGMTTDVRLTDDGELVFRGARKGDMIYMMDGIKSDKIGTVPSCSIARIMVYSGGLPAKYGDTTGGVVVMETLSYFDLLRSWQSEQRKSGALD